MQMISDAEVRMAAWIIHQACQDRRTCDGCPYFFNCVAEAPNDWEIPDPPPEPTERQRIEWLRMLPDGKMLDAVIFVYDGRIDYNAGPMDWWHEVVTLEQFRKDVGMNY